MMAIQQIAPPKTVDPAVEAELDRLPTMPIADLRKRYGQLFRTEPPKAFGPELVRTWKGKSYRVMVMADGFAHDGRTFTSLSEIASEITGTNWNGPRFFGLRSAVNKQATDGR